MMIKMGEVHVSSMRDFTFSARDSNCPRVVSSNVGLR